MGLWNFKIKDVRAWEHEKKGRNFARDREKGGTRFGSGVGLMLETMCSAHDLGLGLQYTGNFSFAK